MDARELFLIGHAYCHGAAVNPDATIAREERLCLGLSEAELRLCPEGRHNSIAWLIWHMARCEDVMINTVLRHVPEVLDDGWLDHLGVKTRHIGTGDTMAEVEAFSQQVDVMELRRYRGAVAQATQKWVIDLDFASLDEVLARTDVERAAQRGAFGERADWLLEYWGNEEHSRGWQLSRIGITHNHSHLGEGFVTRGLIELARQ
jgi:hypothetical protein